MKMRTLKALIGPSLLACDLSNMHQEALRVLAAGADSLHLDVMDGHFVPNISFGAPVISSLRKNIPDAIFDVHLMVSHPGKWVADMAAAGANIFTFHEEVDLTAEQKIALIEQIKTAGMQVGISIKPNTPVSSILPYLDLVDLVLVMTVEPGFGGQRFMTSMMPKVAELRALRPQLNIQVDGGLAVDTIDQAAEAGANMIVAGSAVFKADPKAVIDQLRHAVERKLLH